MGQTDWCTWILLCDSSVWQTGPDFCGFAKLNWGKKVNLCHQTWIQMSCKKFNQHKCLHSSEVCSHPLSWLWILIESNSAIGYLGQPQIQLSLNDGEYGTEGVLYSFFFFFLSISSPHFERGQCATSHLSVSGNTWLSGFLWAPDEFAGAVHCNISVICVALIALLFYELQFPSK